ncbi:5 deoxy cytosolic type c protein domain containing protein [Nannochloropsis gaditana CCMP526]|uniref:5 deoxy cytosolic type c protein domain containing protein n=1 Tax=Nannochloropsis gaditana (strain CCMP526) TaxID=1093141 RepID=UPI00029F7AD3|nr:5 deoxy cytosolic type c protein domain containing protein [Nannochloropsis gaditana CCMP526]EKU21290.1 5 deoxy cytosolic type c protein domain containing protein [Nannochloropsis gaditana CCMP526]|eukprot:XP_005855067.1 5 deoxy cytosolic type c protein domain containing protein [Nannochloropsis gaditana CCMP526]
MSSISRPPLVVAVDLDEVLGLFVETLARFHNEVYGGSLTADDFHSYDFVHVWGGTREEANAKVLAFFKSSHFQFCIQRETEEWVQKHYPGIFTGLHYGNHYSATGPQRSKGDMCQAIKAQLLVDDSLRYAHQVAQDAGIPVLLFGDYAWNQADPSLPPSSLPPSITRVTRWEDVRVHIEALLASHRQQHRERGGGET